MRNEVDREDGLGRIKLIATFVLVVGAPVFLLVYGVFLTMFAPLYELLLFSLTPAPLWREEFDPATGMIVEVVPSLWYYLWAVISSAAITSVLLAGFGSFAGGMELVARLVDRRSQRTAHDKYEKVVGDVVLREDAWDVDPSEFAPDEPEEEELPTPP